MSQCCNTCKKTPPEVRLKHCAKCSTTLYCSRDCQKADWKTHKKQCRKAERPAASSSSAFPDSSAASPPKGLDQPVTKPFTRLDQGKWLHDRPEKDVYRLLIDSYRMHVEDSYTMDGDVDDDSVYSGAGDGLRGFRRYMRSVASRPGLLPPWWDASKQQACEALGMDRSEWQDLRCAIEKSDVIEHYGDARFPMQLRMFSEAVLGRGPGGTNGTTMRKMMVAMENGGMEDGMEGMTIDMTTMNSAPL